MKKRITKKYSFAVSGLYKGLTAEVAANEIERIRNKYGKLKPEYVVAESTDAGAVLHDVFEWDDDKAAQQFRTEQARLLIKNIRVEIIHNKVTCNVRAFVNVRESKDVARDYVPIEKAILDDNMYQDLLKQSKDDMDAFVTKYAQITELNQVKVEMLKVMAQIQ